MRSFPCIFVVCQALAAFAPGGLGARALADETFDVALLERPTFAARRHGRVLSSISRDRTGHRHRVVSVDGE